jgi:hypothetical protein
MKQAYTDSEPVYQPGQYAVSKDLPPTGLSSIILYQIKPFVDSLHCTSVVDP